MRHYVDVVLKDGKKIKIKFLDNPFIEKFIEHLTLNNSICEVVSWDLPYPLQPEPYDKVKVEGYTNQLKRYIKNLNNLGLNYPIP